MRDVSISAATSSSARTSASTPRPTPLLAEERNTGYEQGKPVKIGDNVWIGGSVTILGGVTIDEGAVIGAGSVVTRDIPAGVIAVGNPCHPLREITDADRVLHDIEP